MNDKRVIAPYGVISCMVARRTNEIGIRMALGAGRSAILKIALNEAVVLLAIGLAVGAVLALAVGTTANALLFGLKAYDPLTLALASALLAGVAVVGSYLPARRASKTDPAIALRHE